MAALVIVTTLVGCTTHRPLRLPGPAAPAALPGAADVEPGQQVRIQLVDGRTLIMTVAEVHEDALISDSGQRIPFASMARLERHEVSVARTVILVGVGLALVIVLVYGIAVASLASNLSSPRP
jgi:hypothetical protein